MAKQNIINLYHHKNKRYATVVLNDSVVTFLIEEEDVAFCPSLYCIMFIYGIAKWK